MIKVKDTIGVSFWLNRNNIESLVKQDDGHTLVKMVSGSMYLIKEAPEQIIGVDNDQIPTVN